MLYLKLHYAMKYIKLYEDFQLGDLNFMSPEEIQKLFFEECGKTPSNLQVIRAIIENGLVDINLKHITERTGLHFAISSNNIETTKLHIELGADVSIPDMNGRTPLDYAVIGQNPTIIQLLWRQENKYDYHKIVYFNHKSHSDAKIWVIVTKDGRIGRVTNTRSIRFPFQIGQMFNKSIEVWACNNQFLMDGKDTCPEEKIFGIRKKDIPAGHEFRRMFPSKFK